MRLIYLASHKIETDYRSLLQAKAQKLRELDKASDQQRSLLSEQLTQARTDEVEIQEALQAGKAVQREIQVAHSYLSNADSFR